MKVSVVIPAYNAESTIGKCIDSLLNQDYDEDYEIIVVDDNSSDSTKAVVERFKMVKLLPQKKRGPAAARNLGARNAEGEVVCFIDSDCIAERNWLREITRPFEDGDIAGVQGAYKINQSEIIARFEQLEIENRYRMMKKAEYIDHIGTYSAAYKKEVFLQNNGFDELFPIASGEDIEFSFRLASKGKKLVFNPGAVVIHKHPVSILHYLKTKFLRGYYRVRLYKKHTGKTIKDSYTPQTIKFQIGLFYLIFPLLVAGLINPIGFYLAAAAVLLLLASSIPFVIFALKRDFIVAMLSPIIVSVRTAALALGFAYGFFTGAIGK